MHCWRLEPYAIMGLDPSRSYGLFVSGWGQDSNAEAIPLLTQRADGRLYWHSILIAPTKFINDPSTLIGAFAVVRVALNDVLNIRAGAGVSQPSSGRFRRTRSAVMRTGPTASADNATWVEVQNPNGGRLGQLLLPDRVCLPRCLLRGYASSIQIDS